MAGGALIDLTVGIWACSSNYYEEKCSDICQDHHFNASYQNKSFPASRQQREAESAARKTTTASSFDKSSSMHGRRQGCSDGGARQLENDDGVTIAQTACANTVLHKPSAQQWHHSYWLPHEIAVLLLLFICNVIVYEHILDKMDVILLFLLLIN